MKRFTILALFIFTALFTFAQKAAKAPKPTFVAIETTKGTIKVKLYDDTPEHKYNFLLLVKNGTYKGLLFHRVIKNFMIQGGDPDSRTADSTAVLGRGTIGYTLPAEIRFPEHYHKRGALAAARTSDAANPKKESSGSQFYIVTGKQYSNDELDGMEQRLNEALLPPTPIKYSEAQRMNYRTFGGAPHLDGQYTVFGEVVSGFEVLDEIQETEVGKNDRPKEDVRIVSMKVVKK